MRARDEASPPPRTIPLPGHGQRHQAVVLGGSMAGLFAARVLAEHYERVVLLERDVFPEPGAQRKGVPQGRHTHALLASGRAVMEELFPGITAELVALGAHEGDAGLRAKTWIAGHWLAPCQSGLHGVAASRPLLEAQVRARVLQHSNVRARERCSALGLIAESGRVRAVRIASEDGSEEELAADLVVDATGRASKLPRWLVELGFEPPYEEHVELGIGYTTCVLRREPHHADGATALLVAPEPPIQRGGLALAVEGDRWIVTLVGYLGNHAPRDLAGFTSFASGLGTQALHALVHRAEPLEELTAFQFPKSQRRRYEQLSRLPAGVLAIGDALCSFNPIFGQGMSIAALEAQALQRCLRRHDGGQVAQAFYRAVSRIVDPVWRMTGAADRRFSGATHGHAPGEKAMSAYVLRLQRAGAQNPAAARALLEVMHLVRSPPSLLAPSHIWRAVCYGGGPPGRADERLALASPDNGI